MQRCSTSDTQHATCNMHLGAACNTQRPRRTSLEVCRWRTAPCGPGQYSRCAQWRQGSTMQPDPCLGTKSTLVPREYPFHTLPYSRYRCSPIPSVLRVLRCATQTPRKKRSIAAVAPSNRFDDGLSMRGRHARACHVVCRTPRVGANRRAVMLFATDMQHGAHNMQHAACSVHHITYDGGPQRRSERPSRSSPPTWPLHAAARRP